jgi:peptidoglycan hydrolase-like protein with peptidoglycan-binding domain
MKFRLIFLAILLSPPFAFAVVTMPFSRDLYQGMAANEETYRLSIVLKKEGYYSGLLTREYTPAIASAVSKLQTKRGIPADGVLGKRTRYEANKIVLSWFNKKDLLPNDQATKIQPQTVPTKPKLEVNIRQKNEAVPPVGTPKKEAELPVVKKVESVVCMHRGTSIRDGEKIRLYRYERAPAGSTRCPSQQRRCVKGALDGDLSYRYRSCTVPEISKGVSTDSVSNDTKKQTSPVLDDTKTGTKDTPKTNPKATPKTTPSDDSKGCISGGVPYPIGGKLKGCIGPGRTDPTAAQCLAILMPTYTCTESKIWICTDTCQANYN